MDEALTKTKTNKDREAGMVEINKEKMQVSFTKESRVEGIKGIVDIMALPTDGPHGPLPYSEPISELGLRLMDKEDPPMAR